MADRQHKVLRVGVIQGGKIVEERVLPSTEAVTIGSSAKATIAVPASKLAPSTLVFGREGDRWTLWFEEGVEGRIQGPQGAVDFGALVAQGLAHRRGKAFSVEVKDDQRGKLVLADVTLLWQFVEPVPDAPRPVLPKGARGNHFTSLDRLFGIVLAISFAAHTGAYVALANTAVPAEVTLEEIPDRYAKVLIPERLPKPPEKIEEKKAEPVAEKKADKKEEPEKKAESTEQVAAKKAARAAAVAKAVQSKGLLKVLGALGPGAGSGGAVADVFGSGGGIGDVASALSGAGGVAVANDPGAGGGRKGGGQGEAASIGDLATTGGGGGKVGYGAKSEVEVRVSGSVAAEEAEIDSADVDQGRLAAFVKARMGLVKACYENGLKRNPNLKGKISVRFTILETGGLSEIAAAQNTLGSPEVAACIVNTMRAWRMPFRPSGPVTVEYPFVFSPVN